MTLLIAAYLGLSNLLSIDTVGSIDDVLSRVSKTTGQKFVVDPEIGAMNVYAHLQDVGLDEFKKRLADVTRATWTEKPGISSLRRTSAQTRRIEQERVAALMPGFSDQLSKLRPGLDDEDFKRAAKSLAKALQSAIAKDGLEKFVGPADALLNELLREMGAKRLAELPLFRNYQFSNQPTLAEGTLSGADTLVPRFEALSRAFADEVTEESMQANLYKNEFDRIVVAAHHTGSVGRVLLSLYSTFFATFALVNVYDSQGKEITSASGLVTRSLVGKRVEISNGTESIDWPAETKIVVGVLKKTQELKGHEALVDNRLAEPLGIQAVPGLRALASSRATQILSVLPDKEVATLLQKSPQTANDFSNTLATAGVDLRVDGGWLIGDARPGFFDIANYLSRPVLRQWVDTTRSKSLSWLRRFSALYSHGGDGASNGIISWFQSSVWPVLGVVDQPFSTTRWALRALGSCSDSEWEDLERGNPISVIGPMDRMRDIEQWSCQGPMILEMVNGSTCADVERIGTVSFPGGPPDTATIRLSNHNVHVVGLTANGKLAWMEMYQIANWACEAGQPRPDTEDAALRAMKGQFKLGLRPGGKIVATLNPRFCLTADQPDGEIIVTSEPASIDAWPSDYLDEFKAAVREFLAIRGRGGSPPPP